MLSSVATKLGTHSCWTAILQLCARKSRGRSSYARPMIDLRADIDLKDKLVVAFPKLQGDGYILNTIRVEYE